MYDLIGDIHGCARTLRVLLRELGYRERDCVFQHPSRRAIFLGDFIDRGPYQEEVLGIVRPMIEDGNALSVMGNHEFNAIAWFTDDGDGWLREHSEKNRRQHQAFLDEFEGRDCLHGDTIEWFKTLPLWLDLDEFRVVHACWDANAIERISAEYGGAVLSDELLRNASDSTRWEFEAVETLLKGKELRLPGGAGFHDKDGNWRDKIRVRWWGQEAATYRSAFLGPKSVRDLIPDEELCEMLQFYSASEPPVFLGHYWMDGDPEPLARNMACLDYSVANPGGKLVAYRWNGEKELYSDHFVSVNRVEAKERNAGETSTSG